jgi:hypothetical protein
MCRPCAPSGLTSYREGLEVVVNASCDGTSDWAYYQCPPPAKCAFWNDTAQRWSTEVDTCPLPRGTHLVRSHTEADTTNLRCPPSPGHGDSGAVGKRPDGVRGAASDTVQLPA